MYKIANPVPPRIVAKIVVCADETCPVGSALPRVRAIIASILCSIRQLKAAAAPDANAMPSVVASNNDQGTMPGVARNIAMMAVNTMSEVTLGLQSEKKLLKLIPMLCMVVAVLSVMLFNYLQIKSCLIEGY